VVRPRAIDISILAPYPYPTSGDSIPIRAKVLNIGGTAAQNVDVNFKVVLGSDIVIYNNTVTIDTIQPLESADTTVYWNTALTHPDYYGEIGDCEFIVTADPGNAIEESWEYNNTSSITKKVALYPNKPGWPKKAFGFSQPAIANLDGVGSVEIVYASASSIYVFDKDGNVLPNWPQCFTGVFGIVLGDIDNNDSIDIVAVSGDSIKVYDYHGNILPGWPKGIPVDNYMFAGLPALGYIDDADSTEIITLARYYTAQGFEEGQVKIFVYNYNGVLRHEFTSTEVLGEGLWANGASIENVISGGNDEILISYGKEPSDFYTEIFNKDGSQSVLKYGNNRATSALVDINNDNYADIIIGSGDAKIMAYDVENDVLLWEYQTGGSINSSPAVGDMHPLFDGVEVTFGNDASRIHLRRGINGVNIYPWWYTITPNTNVRTSPAIANINGDRYLDIVVGANNQYIYAFKHTKEFISPFPLPLFGQPSSPIIGDIDGDKRSEVIISSSDGYLHVWENMDSEVSAYLLEWPQFHHDYQRTGVYSWGE